MRTARAAPAWAWSRAAGAVAGCGLLLLVASTGATLSVAGAATRSAESLSSVMIPAPDPGYSVSSQGPLDAARFASNLPDPVAAEAALSTLAGPSATYERVWQADGGRHEIEDLLVRFTDVVGARVFLQTAQHSLDSGKIVSSDLLPSIPEARRVTYFAANDQNGVGEAVTIRAGLYVDFLSFFSAAGSDAQPIPPASVERVAQAQHAAMVTVPGGAVTATGVTGTTKNGVSAGTMGFAVLVVAVLAAAVAIPALLRHRQAAPGPAVSAAMARQGEPSDGDAVGDLRERSG